MTKDKILIIECDSLLALNALYSRFQIDDNVILTTKDYFRVREVTKSDPSIKEIPKDSRIVLTLTDRTSKANGDKLFSYKIVE